MAAGAQGLDCRRMLFGTRWGQRGCAPTGQLWAYVRDDRPCGGMYPPMVAYVYAPDRKSERAEAHLGDFAGILQVD